MTKIIILVMAVITLSAGAWVAKAIRYVVNYPKTKSVRFSISTSNGSVGGAF